VLRSTLDPARAARGFRAARRVVAALAVPLLLAACGGTDGTAGDDAGTAEPTGSDEQFPVEVLSGPVDGGSEVSIESRPESIVSLSPTATEMLWAVGAGDQVVAVDEQSDYPDEVPVTDLSGYNTNVEAVLEYEPDLVIAQDDLGDLVAGLDRAAVPTLLLPAAADLDEAYSQIERVGAATGNVGEAAEVVSSMQSDIDEVLSEVPEREQPLTYYHELDPSFYSVTGEGFIGQLYSMVGMESIGDGADDGDNAGYTQLSAEHIVSSDPDVIMLADGQCCDVTPQSITERPGWAELSAVQNDQIHVLDENVASRWGPRVVDLVEALGTAASEATPATSPAAD